MAFLPAHTRLVHVGYHLSPTLASAGYLHEASISESDRYLPDRLGDSRMKNFLGKGGILKVQRPITSVLKLKLGEESKTQP
jgi:hypothetical protein